MTDFFGWRSQARQWLRQGVPPDQVMWQDGAQTLLFADDSGR